MKNSSPPPFVSLTFRQSLLWLIVAATCFHAAYTSLKFPAAGPLIFGYAFALVKLCGQSSVRRAFYWGLVTAFLCYAPQTFFLWKIFGVVAPVLWLVLAFWVGLFCALACAACRRWGFICIAWLLPVLWTGVEFFRSELYWLKFSWLNVGYALPLPVLGMYGSGFLVFAVAAWLAQRHWLEAGRRILPALLVLLALVTFWPQVSSRSEKALTIAGVQLEFPAPHLLPKVLDHALFKNPDAQIFVLSEYTLEEPPTDALKDWCRTHARFLVVGGKEFVTNNVYFNTAFVIGTDGEVVFQQAKSVPIQFFQDGLPAKRQAVWNSPWGKIGICICYDLSYTRVTDELIRQGAQLLIVPTMDVEGWGRHQHELHSRVAPVRAAEYGVPIFRLASSGISQAVSGNGILLAAAPMPGNGDTLVAKLELPSRGVLPLDRFLAPACTIVTAAILGWLLLAEFFRRKTEVER